MRGGTRDAGRGAEYEAASEHGHGARGRPGLRYMPALDGVRALAVLAVLLYHGDVSWARGGYFGVDAFFVLSGFLITSLLVEEWERDGRIDLKAFWLRRARRLLPAIGLVLAAVVAYAAFVAMPVELSQLRRDALSALSYLANWNQIFSDVSYFEQYAAPSPLRHTWSLAIEEQFYLLWPVLILALLRWRRGSHRALIGLCAFLAVGSAVWMAWLHEPGADPSRVYYGTDTRAQSLVLGALLAALLARRRSIASLPHRAVLHGFGIVAALGLAWIWTSTSEGDDWQYRGGFALAAVLVATVIASVTQHYGRGPLGRVLSWAPLLWVGAISYGLYLWHWPIYVYLSPDRTQLDGASLLTLRLAVTFVLATASFLLVEHPIRRGALRGWTIRVVAPATAVALVVLLTVATSATVPPAFDDVTASQVQPPPLPAPAASRGIDADVAATAAVADRPVRVMLVGDSVARSLAPGLGRAATARGFLFWDTSVPGCSLATDVGERWFAHWQGLDDRCVPGWRTRWQQQVAEFRPDVVVALFGAQDAFDRRIDGQVVPFDTPEGANLAGSDLQEAVDVLVEPDTHLVLLTAPYYKLCCPMRIDEARSPMNEAWIAAYNDVQRAVARHNPGRVTLLNLNHTLDPDGTWTDTVQGVKVRSFDRSHLSEEGADFVAAWLVPHLLRLGSDVPEPGDQSVATGLPDLPRSLLASIPFVAARG